MRTGHSFLAGAASLLAVTSAVTTQAPTVVELMTKALMDFPGREAQVIIVEYAPGAADPVHRHDAHAFIYVLEGSIVMGVNGGKEVTLKRGQMFYEGPDDVHTVGRNASATEKARFLVFVLKQANRPLVAPAPASAAQAGITRNELQRHDLSTPGREMVQVRVGFDPGAEFGRHRHPGEEIVNVLSGVLEYQVEGRPPVTLRAGDVLFIPAGTIHSARNLGSEVGAELATYLVAKGKPILELVK